MKNNKKGEIYMSSFDSVEGQIWHTDGLYADCLNKSHSVPYWPTLDDSHGKIKAVSNKFREITIVEACELLDQVYECHKQRQKASFERRAQMLSDLEGD